VNPEDDNREKGDGGKKYTPQNRLTDHFFPSHNPPSPDAIDFDQLFYPPEDSTFSQLVAEVEIQQTYMRLRSEEKGYHPLSSPPDIQNSVILKTLANHDYLENGVPHSESGGRLSVQSHRVFYEPRVKAGSSSSVQSVLVDLKNSIGENLILIENTLRQPRWQSFRNGPVFMIVHGRAQLGGEISHTPLYSREALIGEIRDLDKLGRVEQLLNHPHEGSYVLSRITTAVANWAGVSPYQQEKLSPISIERRTMRNPNGTTYGVKCSKGEFRAVVSREPKTCLIKVVGGRAV
jgi:hypothetical protein